MGYALRRTGEVFAGVALVTTGMVGMNVTSELIGEQIQANNVIKGRESVEGNPFYTSFVNIGRFMLDTGTTIQTVFDRFDGDIEASAADQTVARNTMWAYAEGALGYNLSLAALITGGLSISGVYDFSPRIRSRKAVNVYQ